MVIPRSEVSIGHIICLGVYFTLRHKSLYQMMPKLGHTVGPGFNSCAEYVQIRVMMAKLCLSWQLLKISLPLWKVSSWSYQMHLLLSKKWKQFSSIKSLFLRKIFNLPTLISISQNWLLFLYPSLPKWLCASFVLINSWKVFMIKKPYD